MWVREDRDEARPPPRKAPARAGRSGRGAGKLPEEVGQELRRAIGQGSAAKLERQVAQAVRAYERDRYQEAQRLLAPVVRAAPGAAAVQELYGLCLYRRGRWHEAVRHLESFGRLTGSYDQYPVLADCHRALGHTDRVRELWDQLRRASPGADLVAEGRIVMAETLADRGDLAAAISLLERSLRPTKAPKAHHVRQWYALADLYERAGELARARDLFARVLDQDPELSDTAERLAALG